MLGRAEHVPERLGPPPPGRFRPGDVRPGLVGVQAELSQQFRGDLDGEHPVPVSVVALSAGQVDAHVSRLERHPVDAVIEQSIDERLLWRRATCQILVRQHGDPLRILIHHVTIVFRRARLFRPLNAWSPAVILPADPSSRHPDDITLR